MPLMIIMWQFPLWLFPLLTPEGTIMCHGAFPFKNMKVIVSTGNREMSLILYSAISSHQTLLHPSRKTVRLLSRPIFLYVSCVSNPHTTNVCVSQPADYQWHNLCLGPVCHAANKPNPWELSCAALHLTDRKLTAHLKRGGLSFFSLPWQKFKQNRSFFLSKLHPGGSNEVSCNYTGLLGEAT